jgi:hypothetical protein
LNPTGIDRPERPDEKFGFGEGVCPDPEMLAAYIDGQLTPLQRDSVADHVSRCEECYEVVRETSLTLVSDEEAAEDPSRAQEPTSAWGVASTSNTEAGLPAAASTTLAVPPDAATSTPVVAFPRRRWFRRLSSLAAAAVVVVGGGYFAKEQGLFLTREERAVLPLVKAVGERRFLEPRLTGGFMEGPLIGPKRGAAGSTIRGASGPAADDWGILAAVAAIESENSPASAVAAARLLVGDPESAVQTLETALAKEPANARLLSDLSAAYFQRAAVSGRAEDHARGLEIANRALEAEPGLPEALFNRALILEAMSSDVAGKAWSAFVDSTSDESWRAVAREHLAKLAIAK